ncbi:hypothetical protein KMW28_27150 [Flammeovirga yaeyamensis]|uniref:DUF2007 domain-containing protein n=1 Tax=Flammeovirga yaeyamensis TaxID=367791 RepID=A0AAX1NEF0_9BACT|nr:hypothetical protein [Flammeovirga yaeyamensis]MBB3700042.1 hypothetical protein [Flammeovirga yaeyamensis]NMF37521.1 hypothetical protein [Flammeovirga yaeyamensis]QWG04578.1 hypothetical protein KMW28_27150 [Flammeovirga yaeyamensis]
MKYILLGEAVTSVYEANESLSNVIATQKLSGGEIVAFDDSTDPVVVLSASIGYMEFAVVNSEEDYLELKRGFEENGK